MAADQRMTREGSPKEPQKRLEIARHILERTNGPRITREDLLLDCLAESSAVNDKVVLITLEIMKTIKRETGVNLVLAVDLMLCRDRMARRYTNYSRKIKSMPKNQINSSPAKAGIQGR